MSISLKEDDKSTSKINPQGRNGAKPGQVAAAGVFAQWRSATDEQARDLRYPLEFDKFSFDRTIDSASPIFFDCCCKSTTFDKAILVKRLSQGDQGGVARPTLGYLRMEFTTVLLTAVNWDDGDVVKEHCEFICHRMELKYRQQKITGDMGAEMPAIWPTARSLNIRRKQ